eukprot:Rmarinus@m.12552
MLRWDVSSKDTAIDAPHDGVIVGTWDRKVSLVRFPPLIDASVEGDDLPQDAPLWPAVRLGAHERAPTSVTAGVVSTGSGFKVLGASASGDMGTLLWDLTPYLDKHNQEGPMVSPSGPLAVLQDTRNRHPPVRSMSFYQPKIGEGRCGCGRGVYLSTGAQNGVGTFYHCCQSSLDSGAEDWILLWRDQVPGSNAFPRLTGVGADVFGAVCLGRLKQPFPFDHSGHDVRRSQIPRPSRDRATPMSVLMWERESNRVSCLPAGVCEPVCISVAGDVAAVGTMTGDIALCMRSPSRNGEYKILESALYGEWKCTPISCIAADCRSVVVADSRGGIVHYDFDAPDVRQCSPHMRSRLKSSGTFVSTTRHTIMQLLQSPRAVLPRGWADSVSTPVVLAVLIVVVAMVVRWARGTHVAGGVEEALEVAAQTRTVSEMLS